MNIFFLDADPKRAAQMQCDKHVVKMVLETAQMLSTAARAKGHDVGYKSAYPKHPMTLWVGQSPHNFAWTIIHGMALCREYTLRYDKIHATEKIINDLYDVCKGNYVKKTEPPQCMPDYCKDDDVVKAYRNYYILEKNNFAVWKYSGTPDWYTKGISHALL